MQIKRGGKGGKIKNATKIEFDGIKFKSKLEAYAYRRFKEEGLKFKYEAHKYHIIEKFEYMGEKIRPCTLTPDFVDDSAQIIVEVKGFETDISKLKRKLLKKHFHIMRQEWTIYLVKSQRQIEELITKLKSE